MREFFIKNKHIHFIGIGGIGMSGMAELLMNHGFKISGSDLNENDRTTHLNNLGVNIIFNHNKKNIENCDLIVYSSAINKDNVELVSGKKNNLPCMKRSDLLGEIIKIKNISIGVAGTHGKTTTSSMLGTILFESMKDPTLIIGGIVNKFNSNNISGNGDIIVVEADEFDRSFLSLKPTYSIINNLDLEHLDCYKNISDLKETFVQYANAIPFYGKIAINNDSKYLNEIIEDINKPLTTFGIDSKSDVTATKISYSEYRSIFNINYNSNKIMRIVLNCPGKHNIYNALAAVTIALELGISKKNIQIALKKYSGVKRRFEYKYNKNDIMIIDDYAHHPIEIEYTLKAARSGWNKRLISVFEPHLYTRTKDFYSEFAKALSTSDHVIISKIYGAREKPIKDITSQLIINDLEKINYKNSIYIENKNDIPAYLKKIVSKNDMVLCMGAGKINTIIKDFIKEIERDL
tara:strand:- start:60 stop:1448 length:1389 start_codon:yes stop_codon:yes gene_type:complete